MAPRRLRFVATTPRLVGACQACNVYFTSNISGFAGERDRIREKFSGHKCVEMDRAQNALRMVREATENE